MLVPLSWLKEYVDISLTPEELAEKLLVSGTKVEDIRRQGEEVVFDLEITPNRPDELSIVGVAREIAAITNREFKVTSALTIRNVQPETIKPIEIKVEKPLLCPRYAVVVIDGVEVKTSPEWLAKRLERAGMRPLYNLIDITNYLMLELGQPMHAFDYDKIVGHQMIVRASRKGEKIVTLDGAERAMPEDSIVIQDRDKIIDLAGLMGGENSEITPKTKTVLLHSPIYDPVRIRRASKAISLRTEASARFEKLLDLEAYLAAARRGLDMILELAGGEVASEFINEVLIPIEPPNIELPLEKVHKVLGIKISEDQVVNILSSLGFTINFLPLANVPTLNVTPPSWRRDINLLEDLTEEVGRIYGYNKFPLTLPSGQVPTHEDAFHPDWERRTKAMLKGFGLNEVYGHTLINQDAVKKIKIDPSETVKVNNPMSSDFEYLRPSLLPGLLQALSLNQRFYKEIALFELGRIFIPNEKGSKLPEQPKKLSGILTGNKFYQVKGLVQALFEELNIKDYSFEPSENDLYLPQQAAKILLKDGVIGSLGMLNQSLLQSFDIKGGVANFDLDFEKIHSSATDEVKYQPLPKYPAVEEDLALVVNKDVLVGNLIATIKSAGGSLVVWAQPFDVYEDLRLGLNKKSIAIRIKYQSPEKTLTDNDVKVLRQKILKALEKEHEGVLRE
ncbi:MAG: phenylalanine--tRNA ligase subunit beta [Patescibacteria group bacterium]|nr:phenylalanine--tRNA ligase subunit beta [Patescibacteria group bacterium]